MLTPSQHPVVRKPDWPIFASAFAIASGVAFAYAQTLHTPFVLDDSFTVIDNASIRHLLPLSQVLNPPSGSGSGGRPSLNLSFAVNYALGGQSVIGYHVFNLIIHILAGCALFGLVRRTLERPVMKIRFHGDATILALIVSSIWVVHPLLTQSVTYISERSESMMGLFYLFALYCFARATDPEIESADNSMRRSGWYGLSILACFGGVGSKEVAVTIPLLALLYDRSFISLSFRESLRRRWWYFMALASSWILLAYLVIDLRKRSVGFGQGVSLWIYWLTECRAIVKYVGLVFWPHPLVFDYGVEFASGISEIWPYSIVLLVGVGGMLFALRRAPVVGFCCAWAFLILSPTSSLIPIMGSPMAENRMYLPLAGLVALVVLGTYGRIGRRSLGLFAIVFLTLIVTCSVRNRDYSSALTLWSDTVSKMPKNYRAQNNFANALVAEGRNGDAIEHFRNALDCAPSTALPYFMAVTHYNLGVCLRNAGQKDEAMTQFLKSLELEPGLSEAHNRLGISLYEKGRSPEAREEFAAALKADPANEQARKNLAALR